MTNSLSGFDLLRSGSPVCQKVFQTHSSAITSAVLHPRQDLIVVADQSGKHTFPVNRFVVSCVVT